MTRRTRPLCFCCSAHILCARYLLQVIWVNAPSIAARVIEFLARLNRATESSEYSRVGGARTKPSVPRLLVDRAGPFPTTVRHYHVAILWPLFAW